MKPSPTLPGLNGSSHPRKLRIGEVLLSKGLVTEQQLAEALARQRNSSTKRLGEILVDMQCLTQEDLTSSLADMLGIPFQRLAADMVHDEALARLPPDFQEQHNVLPLTLDKERLTIAVAAFSDVVLLEDIARKSGCVLSVVAATAENIRQVRRLALRGEQRAGAPPSDSVDDSFDSLLGQIDQDDLRVVESRAESAADLEAIARESPVVALVNNIIKSAVRVSASDIHIEPAEGSLRVRCRIDGELVPTSRPPLRLLPAVVSRIKILAGMDISQRRLPQDGGVTVTLFGRSIDLRVSTMATKFGEKVVIRIVDRGAGLLTLQQIGMSADMLGRFRQVLREPHGILLVTGPTGSGKSTTLYGALAELLSDRSNISTIEDPVERILPGLNQFQVNPKAGFTFASAMRSMLRQDPDVIMVGEIRDPETAKLAGEAALTGHLVLSTLHTNDALAAVPRLVNMGLEPYLVAATLRGVLAQRLVRRLCPDCAHPIDLSKGHVELLQRLCPDAHPLVHTFVAEGCGQCASTGVRARIGVFDLLVVDEMMTTLFDYATNPARLQELADRGGSRGLLMDGLEKARGGQIGLESLLEIVNRASSPGLAAAA